MPISISYNMSLTQTDDEFILLLNNNFLSLYNYINNKYENLLEPIEYYDILMSLYTLQNNLSNKDILKLTFQNSSNFIWSGIIKE